MVGRIKTDQSSRNKKCPQFLWLSWWPICSDFNEFFVSMLIFLPGNVLGCHWIYGYIALWMMLTHESSDANTFGEFSMAISLWLWKFSVAILMRLGLKIEKCTLVTPCKAIWAHNMQTKIIGIWLSLGPFRGKKANFFFWIFTFFQSRMRHYIISIISQRIYDIHLQMCWDWMGLSLSFSVFFFQQIQAEWYSAARFHWMIRIFFGSKPISFSSRTGSLIMNVRMSVYHDKCGFFNFKIKQIE